jgi:hypothetical protein
LGFAGAQSAQTAVSAETQLTFVHPEIAGQETQASATSDPPGTRYRPERQVVHRDEVSEVQLIALAHPPIGVHALHTDPGPVSFFK